MKLLHIDSSILGEASASRALSAAVVARFEAARPDLEVVRRDLTAAPVPHLIQTLVPSAHPLSRAAEAEPSEAADQALGEQVLAEFLDADVVVIGAPMYNFTIPSQLKAWVDRIVVPGRTFKYGPEGSVGLAGDKRVILVLTRGGVFAPDTPQATTDHAESYLRFILKFMGVAAPELIIAEGLMMGQDANAAAMTAAQAAIASLRMEIPVLA